jgi:hypothetical protein
MVQELRRLAVFQLRLYPRNRVSLTALDLFVFIIKSVSALVIIGYYLFQQFTIQLIAAVAINAVYKLFDRYPAVLVHIKLCFLRLVSKE